jgi:hypothetical protein
MQRNLNEVGLLTDEQRLREIAGILAAGILRLHSRTALPPGQTPGPKKPADSSLNDLEVPSETRLIGHSG